MAASAGTLMCVLLAIVVDLASLALAGRTVQGAADLAALSAAANLDRAAMAAAATAQANLGEVRTQVQIGRYVPDPQVSPGQRFAVGGASPNAARVTVTRTAPLYFGRWVLGRATVDVSRTGTAATPADRPRAMFSIGSRLARLEGGVANQLLSGLTGSTVSLSLMDYEALADAKVNLLGFSDALATELGVTAGDYQALLTRDIRAGRALTLLRDLAGDQGDSALSKLIPASGDVTVRLGDLIGFEAGAEAGLDGGLDASISVLDLVMAMLETGGDRQVKLALGARAGLADLTVDLAIGERPNRSPWLTVTGEGEPIVRTAQARLYLRARTALKLSGLAQVHLPILIELAASEARLDAIDCEPESVTLEVRPGLATATIGSIDETRLGDFTRDLSPDPATLLNVLGVVRLTGEAEVEVADVGFRSARFNAGEIESQTVKTVTATQLATGLVSSLIQRMDVTVHALGLGLGLGGIVQALGSLLSPIGPVLDAAMNPILDLLGLRLGQADVRVHAVACPSDEARPVLVG